MSVAFLHTIACLVYALILSPGKHANVEINRLSVRRRHKLYVVNLIQFSLPVPWRITINISTIKMYR